MIRILAIGRMFTRREFHLARTGQVGGGVSPPLFMLVSFDYTAKQVICLHENSKIHRKVIVQLSKLNFRKHNPDADRVETSLTS